jgi:hypothetical protein
MNEEKKLQEPQGNGVLPCVRLSLHTCDAVITKHVDMLDTSEGQDQYTHDTAFINGAIWMRGRIADMLGE